MKEKTEYSSVTIAYILSALILIGMSLPWAHVLDFSARTVGAAVARGWNIKWLPILALVAVGTYIYAYSNEGRGGWLRLALVFSIASLIPIIDIGVDIVASKDTLILSKVPLIGFWIALISFIGVISIAIRNIIVQKGR